MNASASLRSAAAMLIAQADMLDIEQTHDVATPPAPTNIYSGSNFHNLPGPIPQEFQAYSPENIYGARADIGSPNNQAMLRAYAARDGFADLNHYVKTKWTPIWPDAKQEPSPGYSGDQS